MTQEDRINYLTGEISALNSLLRALVATHPNKLQLAEYFESSIQGALAAAIPVVSSEAYLDGFHMQADSLRVGLPKA